MKAPVKSDFKWYKDMSNLVQRAEALTGKIELYYGYIVVYAGRPEGFRRSFRTADELKGFLDGLEYNQAAR